MVVKTFIDRPILSGVISVAIIIVGLIGLSQLPVEQRVAGSNPVTPTENETVTKVAVFLLS